VAWLRIDVYLMDIIPLLAFEMGVDCLGTIFSRQVAEATPKVVSRAGEESTVHIFSSLNFLQYNL
jgi:hypothetical protein